MILLEGQCPLGCGGTLYAEENSLVNRVICLGDDCPDPDTVNRILQDDEMHHLVRFTEGSFTIRHPLRERSNSELMECPVSLSCARMPGPPDGVEGLYRMLPSSSGFVFERVEV